MKQKKSTVKTKLPDKENIVSAIPSDTWESLNKLIIGGDLTSLTEEQRVKYYHSYCQMIGINALGRPFDYIQLNGKLVLYANKGCAEQLRQLHKISIYKMDVNTSGKIAIVTAYGQTPDGRQDAATGSVPIEGLTGDRLSNAIMKAETKSKRRLTLSMCGLNMIDESEIESIPGAYKPPIIPEKTISVVQTDDEKRRELMRQYPTINENVKKLIEYKMTQDEIRKIFKDQDFNATGVQCELMKKIKQMEKSE